jgi:aspartate-semialdehyde dehydrogenase
VSSGLRIAVAGASGTLGRDVVAVLQERRFPVRELVPFATDRSTGEDVEFLDDALPVESQAPPLRGFDLLVLCAPPAASLELVREALRAEVPCIDCSGALAASREVPLLVAELCAPAAALGAAAPRAAGLRRVVGTVLRSASLGGRSGIEALSQETIALLSQRELPDPSVFHAPVAFDCVPTVGERDFAEGVAPGTTLAERDLVRDLQRLLGRPVPAVASVVQVPTFVGDGSALVVETERAVSGEELPGLFEKAPGVEAWPRDSVGPTTRDAAGREVALVGQPRPDPSSERGLVLWVAADAIRMTAVNAVRLAEARLRVH